MRKCHHHKLFLKDSKYPWPQHAYSCCQTTTTTWVWSSGQTLPLCVCVFPFTFNPTFHRQAKAWTVTVRAKRHEREAPTSVISVSKNLSINKAVVVPFHTTSDKVQIKGRYTITCQILIWVFRFWFGLEWCEREKTHLAHHLNCVLEQSLYLDLHIYTNLKGPVLII